VDRNAQAAVDAAWSTPTNLGPTVNSGFSDQHPYLSEDGTTLVFFSNRPGCCGGIGDLWMTTRVDSAPPVIAHHDDVHVITHDAQATRWSFPTRLRT